IIMVANKYAFLQITRRRFLNEWEAFKKVISRRNIRRRITIPLTLSNLNKVWIATDRSRARRCVEACVYGTLDFVGYPRFPAPVEFIAAVIAYYVHPVNIQTACLIMEGAEFTENIINGVERPVKAAELF